MTGYTVVPIGHVSAARSARIDDDWGRVESVIRLDEDRFTPDSLAGLDEFSHAVVVFLFDQFDEAKVNVGARHPRGKADRRRRAGCPAIGEARPLGGRRVTYQEPNRSVTC